MTSAKTSRVRWFLVFWLFILSAVSYLDRVNISIAGGSIAEAYHLSDVQLGKVFSAMLVGYALFQTIGGRLADRFGPRRVLAGGVVWWGIFTALTALVPSNIAGALLVFVAVRFLLGAGEAVIYPSANQFIARWIPTTERGIANGWIFAGVGAGAGLTPLLITLIMVRYGWRSSFWVCSIIGFAAGAVWYLCARDTPAEHAGVSVSELTLIRSGLTRAEQQNDANALVSWGCVMRSKEVWAVTLSYFCYGYVAWIFFSWFYRYLAKVRGLDLKASAFYTMLPFLAMLVCCLLGGAINDRLTKWQGPRVGRCGLATFAIAMAGVFIAFGSQVQSARLASVILAGGAGALYLSQSSFWSLTADISGASSGSVSGFMNMGNQIGAALTATLTPSIADRFGWTTSFLVASLLCVVGAVSWLAIDPSRQLTAARSADAGKRRNRSAVAITVFALLLHGTTATARSAPTAEPPTATVLVDATPGHAINSFDPDIALGSSIDVLSHDGIDKLYTPHVIQESLSAGWGPITYRNNSELRMAAWHWNENGTWSDPAHKSGYFTGSTDLKEPIRYILSYALPHRGFSTSGDRPLQGPNLSYWKSNPYLTSKFTGESDALHPQWVVVDLQAEKPVNAIRIAWTSPYAASYQVEYWVGTRALDFDEGPQGEWKTFTRGAIKNGQGGTVNLRLADAPINTRYLRILMTESSNTCDLHGADDIRNCVGYAIQEIRLGTVDSGGAFAEIQKSLGDMPTTYCTSSIDPWHSAADVDATGGYQHSGFDLFFTSGLTNNLPAMIPVTLLYGTPDDSTAQIAYIEKRGYRIGYVEMGEEPDGKHAMPEDYAALYIQWATAIHKIDPQVKLGGPVFEGVNEDVRVWPDAHGRTSWMGRFVDYLKTHGRISDLAFVSFEHYPFEPCTITWKTLYSEPRLMKHILQVWRDDGVTKEVPLMVTENHLANELTGPMTTIFAALWLADNVGSFFEGGGAAFYHSPIQPQGIQNSCLGWASWSNFVSDVEYDIKGYTSPYFAAHMINLEWVQHRSGVHQMFLSSNDIEDAEGNVLVTSYAVHRPDGNWSLMLVNRDQTNPHTVRVQFEDSKRKQNATFSGQVAFVTFGSEQYVWIDDGPNSRADPDHPPIATTLTAGPDTTFTLPKASITVLRGEVEGLKN
ncbi:MAG: MFS transporter [Candidatus Sulfotelmatobacter sp.]